MTEQKPPPRWVHLQRCPRCNGQEHDVGSCSLCGSSGLLDANGDPYPAGQRIRELEAERDALAGAVETADGSLFALLTDLYQLTDTPEVWAQYKAIADHLEHVRSLLYGALDRPAEEREGPDG